MNLLADLIAATDNLKKLGERRETLISEKARLEERIQAIDTELDRVTKEAKDQIKAAKQAANALKD